MNQATRSLSLFLAFLCFAFSTRAGFFDIESSNGKYGIVFTEGYNKKTKWVVDPIYDSIIDKGGHQNPWNKSDDDLSRFYYLLYKEGKVGVFRSGTEGGRDWEIVLKCQFEKVVVAKGMCAVKKAGKWGLFDGFKASWLLQPEYDNVQVDVYATEFAFNATATKNGKTGLFDIKTLAWVLPFEYDELVIIPNSSVFTRQGQQRGIFYYNNAELFDTYRYWLIPAGNYNTISFTEGQTGNLLVDSLGKKGLWQNYAGRPASRCLVPAQYNHLQRIDVPGSDHYFISDSLGKMGLWKVQQSRSVAFILLPAVYDDLYLNVRDDLTAKQGTKVGLYSLSSGWKTRMNSSDGKRLIYSIFGQTLTVSYNPGVGFNIDSDGSGSVKTLEIPDKNLYDSFRLESSLLLAAYKKGLSTLYYLQFVNQGKGLAGSEFLAEGVDFCWTYPLKKNQERILIENQAIVYRRNGIVSWHDVGPLGSLPQVLTKVPMAVDGFDDFFIKNPQSALGRPLMLVKHKNKYGIVTTDGQVVVPIVHPSFSIINNYTLRFQSSIPGKFRLFDAREAGKLSPQTMDPAWGGLTWAAVKGKKTGDFDSLVKLRLKEVYKIDTGWYYIDKNLAKHTRVLFEGDIIKRFTQGSHQFEVIEKASGVGLIRDGQIVVPATLASISDANGKLSFIDTSRNMLVMPLTALTGNFDLGKGYTYFDANKKCKACNGAGRVETVFTHTTPEQTTYTTKEVLDERPIADLNGRKTYIRYETTAKTTKARTTTERKQVSCAACKGVGKLSGDVTYKLNKGVFQID